jgi:hypothetical protein
MDSLVQEHITNFLYLDIETLPAGEKKSVDEMRELAPKNYKKEESIVKWAEENIEKEYRDRSVHSEKGRLYCICFAMNDEAVKTVSFDDEKKMIESFVNYLLEKYDRSVHNAGWVGQNIKGFDLPWLFHRMVKYEIKDLLFSFPTNPYDKRIIDTAELWAATNRRDYTSLNDICEFLGIETKGDIDGGKVYDYYLEGKHAAVEEYCRKDVERVRKIHNKLRGH